MGGVPDLRALRVGIVTPAPPRSWSGNRVTALRWARLLRSLGHEVAVEQEYRGQRWDAMVALHARRSFPSLQRFSRKRPSAAAVLALTGTDLYGDIRASAEARRSLELADRLVVLQPRGLLELPAPLRDKTSVIRQSATRAAGRFTPRKDAFEVCVLAHLRRVKDPFRAAAAARLLPRSSRIRILHLGAPLERGMEKRARAEDARNPRYRWMGCIPRWKALRVLARCRLLLVTSHLEGGANVVSEALAASVPVLSSRIDGSVGLLGGGYPGYFSVGGTRALARLLERAEAEPAFYAALRGWCERLRPLVDPARERRSWRELLRGLKVSPEGGSSRRRGDTASRPGMLLGG